VHGSIGYSTNLFPAMTLGCGAPGGNITSDNIGPRHLINVKRIAWESRAVEHRSVPAEQRMAGILRVEPAGVAGAGAVAAGAGPVGEGIPKAALAAGRTATAAPSAARVEATPAAPIAAAPDVPAAAPAAASAGALGGFDRARIARLVEQVLAQHNIELGSGGLGEAAGDAVAAAGGGSPPRTAEEAPSALPAQTGKPSPSEIAAELASRVFGSPAAAASAAADSAPAAPPTRSAAAATSPATSVATPPPQSVTIAPFVSENDVRMALTRQEKIYIGRKTIVTPSARDLGAEHDVFIEIDGNTKA
jgi:hypothetical protein